MSQNLPTDTQRHAAPSPKRPYETPRLTVHGSLRDLTRTLARGPAIDNNIRSTFRSHV